MARQWISSVDAACVKGRAYDFTLRITRLAESLPMTGAAGLCGDELLLSAALIRLNCQAAFAPTTDEEEFLNKLQLVVAEARECQAWLELLAEADVVGPAQLNRLKQEADGLVAIIAAMTAGSRPDNNGAESRLQDREGRRLRLIR